MPLDGTGYYYKTPYCYQCKRYMPVSSSSGTGICYACPHQVAYRSSEETYRKLAEREKQPTKEQQFLIDRRNHQVQTQWQKKYQRKTYANYKFR